jgi:glycosyltransferase involved in cell wall biosynthesis
MFSILIPTFNNLNYLKLCISSIKKNSQFNHQIIPHVNIGNDGTIEFLRQENIDFTFTEYNSGICEGINKAAKLAKHDYLLYAHDDFYFSPNWDKILNNEVEKIGHNKFYLSGTMMHNGQIPFDCGDNIDNFNENKFLSNYKNYNHYDFQGSTWAPTLIHKSIWNKVGGFSEEYFPGTGSDPDFNFKLWNEGIRIFKGLNDFKVYHFGSIILRKKISKMENKPKYGSIGGKIFLLKWGISIKFFKKFYLRSNTRYAGPLENPQYNFKFLIYFIKSKINYFYIKLFYRKLNKINFSR